jgi:hypothetical protein
MIHDLVLPDLTKKYLLSLVRLQVTLLDFAASVPNVQADDKRLPPYAKCGDYLDNYGEHLHFKGYGMQIAKTVWGAPTRTGLLKEFSTRFHASDDPYKDKWLERIRHEIDSLASSSENELKIHYFYGDGVRYIPPPRKLPQDSSAKKENNEEVAPLWQQKAGEFFLYFYTTYLEASDASFRATFFPFDSPDEFGKQALLQEFRRCNEDLYICPVCDECSYFTENNGVIHTTLDHYLPKHLYPHFACHPYNLLPTCNTCNSSVKGVKDPLHVKPGESGPGRLHTSAMPYTLLNRKEHAYLKVDLGEGIEAIRIIGLQPTRKLADADARGLRSTFEVLQRVYNIPGRWSEKKPDPVNGEESRKGQEALVDDLETGRGIVADRVSEALFRRMRHFLGPGSNVLSGSHMVENLYEALSLLLYYISEEDRCRDPLTVPMLWILAALLQEEKLLMRKLAEWQGWGKMDTESPRYPAGLNEVLSWCGQDEENVEKRKKKVREILDSLVDR